MFQLLNLRQIDLVERRTLYNAARGNTDFIQRLQLERKLEVHTGCVNTISWNETGTCILSGSDDQHLMVTNPYNGRVVYKIRSGHRQNIFSAKFLPNSNDMQTVSCSGDGKIFYTNLDRDDTYGTFLFDCHFGTTYEVIVIPNEASTFLSCGEDGTVRFFDLRAKTTCTKRSCKDDVLISSRSAVTSLAANPMLPWQLGIGCSDSSVRIYDRRMLGTRATGNYTGKGITGLMCSFTPPSLEKESYRVTSLNFSPDGRNALVSYSSEFIYLFGTDNSSGVTEMKKEVPETKDEAEMVSVDEPVAGTSSGSSAARTAVSDDLPTGIPPVKRLRLRGDWSDTGPGARPERDRRSEARSTPATDQPENPPPRGSRGDIMNTMSDILTRWLYGNLRQGQQEREATEAPTTPETESTGPMAQSSSQNNQSAESVVFQGAVASSHRGQDTGDSTSASNTNDKNVGNDNTNLTSKGEHDSSDCKSDESQSSFVTKIESMNVEDVDASPSGEASQSPGQFEETDTHTNKGKTQEPKCIQLGLDGTDRSAYSCTQLEPNMVPNVDKNDSKEITDSVCTTESQSDQSASALDAESVDGQSDSSGMQPTLSAVENIDENSSDISDNEPTFMVEAGEYREAVNTAVSSLRAQNVKPVVSLHYSREGTSASVIRLGFSNLEDEIAEQNTQLAQNSPPQNSSDANGTVVTDSDSENSETALIETAETDTACCSRNRENLNAAKCFQESECLYNEGKADSLCSEETKCTEPSVTKPIVSSGGNLTTVQDSDSVSELGACAMDTDNCESESAFKLFETEGAFKPFSIKSGNSKQKLLINDKPFEEEDGGNDPAIQVKEVMSQDTDGLQTEVQQYGQDGVDKDISLMQASTSGGISEGSANLHMDVDVSVSREATAADQMGARPRQRRVGHSGPPTGTFQLQGDTGSSAADSSSSDGDDDSRPNLPRRRSDFERTTAALKLQAMHRLRQEAKEKKEMEMKNVFMPKVKHVYKGHRNARTMIKESNFWGDNFVLSGSDCGHVFVWDRYTAKVVMLLEADKHVVNCIQPHPYDMVLATSGIDYDVKIWSPLSHKSLFDEDRLWEVTRCNEIMLEETRDTITVPAAFMLRVLASINSIRSGRRAAERNNPGNSDDAPDNRAESS